MERYAELKSVLYMWSATGAWWTRYIANADVDNQFIVRLSKLKRENIIISDAEAATTNRELYAIAPY